MKTLLAVSLLSAMTVVTPAAAMDNESDSLSGTYTQEWQGMGAGALAGGVVGGPAGIVIGAVGGTLFGRGQGLEGELKETRQELGELSLQLQAAREKQQQLKEQFQVSKKQQDQLEIALASSVSKQSGQLDAITHGFATAIHFRTASAELEPGYEAQLDRLATALKSMPELDVHVDGYSDARGHRDLNMALSKQRANIVIRRLLARGLSSDHIIERSYGEEGAVYPEGDREGLGFDRRVVIHFCRRSE